MRRRAFQAVGVVGEKVIDEEEQLPQSTRPGEGYHEDEDHDNIKRGIGQSLVLLLIVAIIIDSVGVAVNFKAFRQLVEKPISISGYSGSVGGAFGASAPTISYDQYDFQPRIILMDGEENIDSSNFPQRGRAIENIWMGARDDNYEYFGPMKLLRNPVTLDGQNGEQDNICKPSSEWQETFYTNCNGFHEIDFENDMIDTKNQSPSGKGLEMLGVGTMRDAWKVSTQTDKVVLKTLQLEREFSERTTYYQIVDAVATERLTSSPHVQDIYGFCGSSVLNELGREFDVDEGESLSVMDRLRYARDLAAGLADAHGIDGGNNAHLVHADLRQSNVLFSLDSNSLKLSDFNQGYFLGWNQKDKEMCGYRPNFSFWEDDFAAPEECLGKVQSEKTDVYHMGGIIYYLLTGTKPYAKEENPTEKRKEYAGRGKWPEMAIPKHILISRHPAQLAMREAIEGCWEYDPTKRASAKQVYEILEKVHKELTSCKASPMKNTTNISNFQSTVPNVLLVGAQKSGTTATASFLFHHRNVCKPVSSEDEEALKELHFYDDQDNFEKGLDHYGKHFCHCGDNSHVVDATPNYLPYADLAKKTYDSLGPEKAKNVKIVAILREPVDREFSWYNHMTVDTQVSLDREYTWQVMDKKGNIIGFDDYVEKRVLPKLEEAHGQYAKWIKKWINQFGRKNVLVVSYDELLNDQFKVMERLRDFLQLEKRPDGGPHMITEQNKKESTDKSKPTLLCKTQKKLANAFQKANKDLYDLLENNPGPPSEQRPFPKFKLGPCKSE